MSHEIKARRAADRLNRDANIALRSGDEKKAKELFSEALKVDPFSSSHDWQLLEESTGVYRQRIRLRNMIRLRLGDYAARAKNYHANFQYSDGWRPRVFVYWGQGFDEAPDLVKFCYAELLRHHPNDEVVTLTDENLHEWVEVPADLRENLGENRTAFSDVLRLELLSKHGGIWVDSTCLVTENLVKHFNELTENSGFFAFGNGRLFSSWFMASTPDSYLTYLTLQCIRLYWRVFDKPIMYYYLHHTFRFVHTLDSRAGQLWSRAPKTGYDPRSLGRLLTERAANHDGRAIAAKSIVHKLSYKVDKNNVGPGTVYHELISGNFLK